jgi:hypothetical protein
MAAKASHILQNLVQTLQTVKDFASVTLGASGDTTLPAAWVLHESLAYHASDDSTARWGRLSASIVIHTRDDAAAQALQRATDLADLAATCLLADRFRGQLCQDLPIGKATEIGPSHLASGVRRPDIQIRLDVRCHFEEVPQ